MNYYEILSVPRDASADEIEKAYRALARKVHPDLNAGDPTRAEERMKQLNEIRDTLGDPLLRSAYDTQLLREQDGQEAARRAAETGPAGDYVRVAPDRVPGVSEFTSRGWYDPSSETGQVRRRGSLARASLLLMAVAGIAAGGVVFGRSHRLSEMPSPEQVPDDQEGDDPPAPPAQQPAAVALPAAVPAPAPAPVEPAHRDPELTPILTPRPFPRHSTPRGVVKIGSTAGQVLRLFGLPQRTEPGPRPGSIIYVYGDLRLEMRNGVVVGGGL